MNNELQYLVVQNDQFKCLEEERTQPGRSWSRLRDLGLPEQPNSQQRGGPATLPSMTFLKLKFKIQN